MWKQKGGKRIEIKKGNIVGIFTFEGRILFLEGVAHLDVSEGKLYSLERKGNDFAYIELVDLGDAPQCFTILNRSIVVATFKNFYVIKDFKIQNQNTSAFWWGLYPNSMASIGNDVYIGMRGGVAKIPMKSLELRFFKYFE